MYWWFWWAIVVHSAFQRMILRSSICFNKTIFISTCASSFRYFLSVLVYGTNTHLNLEQLEIESRIRTIDKQRSERWRTAEEKRKEKSKSLITLLKNLMITSYWLVGVELLSSNPTLKVNASVCECDNASYYQCVTLLFQHEFQLFFFLF